MNKKLVVILALAGALVLLVGIVVTASAVSGAAYTTFNPWVDGDFKDVCKNTQINCNIYGAKPDVWLNGGPAANGLGPDGEYFFAVLVPGGQPDPNDGGVKNLSDDYDFIPDRTFTVEDGEVSSYGGPHLQDSGDTLDPERPFCDSPRGCEDDADGNPPLIRLFPYADTWNPGGVYILAICSLADGLPVEPADCKYDAFKVKQGRMTYEFMLMGTTYKDFDSDGPPGLNIPRGNFEIHIDGTGFSGESINAVLLSESGDDDGHWQFGVVYNINGNDSVQAAVLEICELPGFGWNQTWPLDSNNDPDCYDETIDPAAMAFVGGLDFYNR